MFFDKIVLTKAHSEKYYLYKHLQVEHRYNIT